MTELQKSNDPLAEDDQLSSNMRKVAITALAGTSIEWYDFFLYATAAALVFPTVFFPDSDPTMGLILSLELLLSDLSLDQLVESCLVIMEIA